MELPPIATNVDPPLREVGNLVPHQQLVFGRVRPETLRASLVAQLIEPHPDGVVGHYYGVRLRGITLGEAFHPWAVDPVGEVQWDAVRGEWVQADGTSV